MAIEIRTNDNGCHEVVKSEPKVLGVFEERGYAEVFARALGHEEPVPASPPIPCPALAPKEAKPAPTGAEAKKEGSRPSPGIFDMEVAERKPAPKVQSTPKADDPDQAQFEAAMDRLEAGEACKYVADDVGLPFGRLRAKWAASIANGTRAKPNGATAPVVTTKPSARETEDSPVSGGVGAVLARSGKLGFTGEEDAQLVGLIEAELSEFAREKGRTIEECNRRKAVLDEALAKMINDG